MIRTSKSRANNTYAYILNTPDGMMTPAFSIGSEYAARPLMRFIQKSRCFRASPLPLIFFALHDDRRAKHGRLQETNMRHRFSALML